MLFFVLISCGLFRTTALNKKNDRVEVSPRLHQAQNFENTVVYLIYSL